MLQFYCTHLTQFCKDVVPIGDRSTWQHDPFGANIVGNVMYGRGTSDMKGGIAAQVYAIEALRQAKLVLRGDIGQSCVVDEETTGNMNAGLFRALHHY